MKTIRLAVLIALLSASGKAQDTINTITSSFDVRCANSLDETSNLNENELNRRDACNIVKLLQHPYYTVDFDPDDLFIALWRKMATAKITSTEDAIGLSEEQLEQLKSNAYASLAAHAAKEAQSQFERMKTEQDSSRRIILRLAVLNASGVLPVYAKKARKQVSDFVSIDELMSWMLTR